MSWQRVGEWAFFAGVIVAGLGGLFIPSNEVMTLVLVILGILVGIINIAEKETLPYLVAVVALLVAGTAGFETLNRLWTGFGTAIEDILDYITNFVAPAAVLVGLKAVWTLAKRK